MEDHPDQTVPIPDIAEEARRLVDKARDSGVTLRLMGGLAVRMQCVSIAFCERPYSDIDLMGLSPQSEEIHRLFDSLGYSTDSQFVMLHGGQRLKFEDRANHRHVEVFLDKFRMDQTLDFRERLSIDPYTISLSDLFLTKAQIVRINMKDFHDLFSIFRDHKIGMDDREGVINAKYIAHLCAHDWGLYHTVFRNLERLPGLYDHFELDKRERESMDTRIWILKLMIIEEPKGTLWRARDRLGERLPYYEEVEQVDDED